MVVRDMGFARTVIGLIALTSGFFYLTSASTLTDSGKWILIGVTFAFTTIWVLMGGRKGSRVPVQQVVHNEEITEDLVIEEVEDNSDIPQPVTQDSLDGASLRERKLAKIKAAELEQQKLTSEGEEVISLEEVEVEIEELHKADEYVVEVSPESVEDADIEVRFLIVESSTKKSEIESRRDAVLNWLKLGLLLLGCGRNILQVKI